MRRPKISLKKYFYLTLIFALLLIFGFNLKERGEWKSSKTPVSQQLTAHAQHRQKQQAAQSFEGNSNNHIDNEIEGPDDALRGSNDDDTVDANVNINNNNDIKAVTTTATYPDKQHLHNKNANDADANESTQQQQQQQQEPATSPTTKLWFFKNGDFYPKPATLRTKRKGKKQSPSDTALFPYQDPHSDRIVNQLMFVPHDYKQIRESGKLKTILLFNGRGPWNVKQGRDVFLRSKCPVDTCELTANRDRVSHADMILYKDYYIPTGIRRPANSKQVNMLYYLECPYHTQNVKVPDAINWTATYRRDSEIVAPYEKWVYYDSKVRQAEQDRNYALNKTKKVAWFVSNCGARNGRLQFAHELQKHIDVDIYGACGNFKCSRSTADKCFEILDHDYKFYLAFENSNCKDYITEKFFVNSLNRNILPIVMGARPEDYEVGAPYRSYIHVDEFASPHELAEYLLILDKDDELYNSYFKWKGTGEFINTYYWCRVCAALHDEESLQKPHWYTNVDDWWRGAGVCTNGSWRNFKARKDIITDD